MCCNWLTVPNRRVYYRDERFHSDLTLYSQYRLLESIGCLRIFGSNLEPALSLNTPLYLHVRKPRPFALAAGEKGRNIRLYARLTTSSALTRSSGVRDGHTRPNWQDAHIMRR